MALTTSVESLNNEDKIIVDIFGKATEVQVISTGDNQFDKDGQYKPDGFALSKKEIAVLNDFLKNVKMEIFRSEITEYFNERYEEDGEEPISEEMLPRLIRINTIAVNVCADDDDDYPEIAFMGACHCDQEFGSPDIEDIRKLRTIIGKRFYAYDNPENNRYYLTKIE